MVKVNDTVIDTYDNLYTVRRILQDSKGQVAEVQGIGKNSCNTRFMVTNSLDVINNPQDVLLQAMAELVLMSIHETYHSLADVDTQQVIMNFQTDVVGLLNKYQIKFVNWYNLNENVES